MKSIRIFRLLTKSGSRFGKSRSDRIREGTFPDFWNELVWFEDSTQQELEVSFGEAHHKNSFRRRLLSDLCQELNRHFPNGDTMEIGIYHGLGSLIIMKNFPGRKHYLVDSFQGLSEPNPLDGNKWRAGDMSVSLEMVKKRLADFAGRALYIQAILPEQLDKLPRVPLILVHIDVDLYSPTAASTKYAWANLVPGGVILFDDYGFTTCPGATLAIDEFIRDLEINSYFALPVATGGLLLMKSKK